MAAAVYNETINTILPTFNTAGTIRLTYPDISNYNPPSLILTGSDLRAGQIANDYNKWRGDYMANMAEYQLHLENDNLEKYRSEINRLGKSLNTYLDEYNSVPTTTNKLSWRHQELAALKPYN